MKKIILISTGGTIAMRFDQEKQCLVPAVSGAELIEAVPELSAELPLEVVEFSNIPSPHMTPSRMLALAKEIDRRAADDDTVGFVITHGTDTVEETAYLLDLTLTTTKPVCLTAAMRSGGETSADGPKNILTAVRTASDKHAGEMGVLVVMNEEIHSARSVTKTHSANPHAFTSPAWGPLGYADEDRIVWRARPFKREHIKADTLVEDVYLVKMATGQDDLLLKYLIEQQVSGIVVEGFGRGNIPPACRQALIDAVQANIPVVLTTRVHAGRVLPVYGYEGGAADLAKYGIILAGDLTAQQARLKLMCALPNTKTLDEVKAYFDNE
ncbi:MAG: asparaginase [Selenomonadales bacterium]|nr:asparaginase [Selenomonadales bacterium]